MADTGEGSKKGRPDKKREEPGKRKGKPGKKAPKAKASKRRRISNGRRRANMIFAIAHPLRRCIMRLFDERGEPLNPIRIAAMLDLPTSLIAYHVTVLRRLGALEPVADQQARDAVEHSYDSTIENDPPVEALLEETRDVDEEDMEERRSS